MFSSCLQYTVASKSLAPVRLLLIVQYQIILLIYLNRRKRERITYYSTVAILLVKDDLSCIDQLSSSQVQLFS